ncbi:MAG TPA: methionine--tRNA ligase, partial [Patescibacteria group bacterium]
YYVNDKPHLGHAYTTIAADVLARFKRLQGHDVFFLTGTDEHGVKVSQSAKAARLSPQEFTDQQSAIFRMAWDILDISNNDFIRTTEPRHEEAAKKFLLELFDKNLIYKDKYEGLYCVGCESYKTDSELVDGKCPDHNIEPILLSEDNWFFKLSRFNDQLKKLIEKDELLVRPVARKNEMLGLLKQGLEDIAISRQKVDWGIPLPFDKSQTAYVWIEALMNYVTGVGFQDDKKRFQQIWPADVHLMAKDIVKFHALIWPAMLLGVGLPLPRQVFAHGFFTVDGKKMSKTLGNVIDPVEISEKYGVDGLKYLIIREISFGEDGDISLGRFDERYNADLANGLGNLVSRVLAIAGQREFETDYSQSKDFEQQVKLTWAGYEQAMTDLKFNDALDSVWKLISSCDKYIEVKKPWELSGDGLIPVLTNVLEAIRQIGWLIQPFMPLTAEEILSQLKVYDTEKIKPLKDIQAWGGLTGKLALSKGEALFIRL